MEKLGTNWKALKDRQAKKLWVFKNIVHNETPAEVAQQGNDSVPVLGFEYIELIVAAVQMIKDAGLSQDHSCGDEGRKGDGQTGRS